jgi:hypothetical protein
MGPSPYAVIVLGNSHAEVPLFVLLVLQWVMINRLVRLMWPKLTNAIFTMVIATIKPMIKQQIGQVSSCCS